MLSEQMEGSKTIPWMSTTSATVASLAQSPYAKKFLGVPLFWKILLGNLVVAGLAIVAGSFLTQGTLGGRQLLPVLVVIMGVILAVGLVSAALIRENLAGTGLEERGRVYRMAVERAPGRLEGPYSLVFADPPYTDDAALASLEQIARSPLVGPETAFVFEHSRRREPPPALGSLRMAWTRRYGDSQVSIYRE